MEIIPMNKNSMSKQFGTGAELVQISALLACKECLCQMCFDLLMPEKQKT
jgi:hypothetical protein